ncbi:cobalamin adenosyltransferase [Photobacterium kishitanii]|uniref:Cobalamin adenosyltransferase n=1 Tax=Photobacterium kishitanii TaxID=318456 RepID=A0A0B7J3Q0_9GAMM|nr:ATP:cob(I)alamin adenosyltransferase [Photobacterium kishitanii]OBU25983.1 cobalamin adenosyltransferase [Photobacterium kishitanii]OBU31905.1 cobalamin adenosyltransferase [Photobacterium kishitanii]PSU88400.1 cobalamin adenosyltransferase [Photobacterium kishitanii]PSU89117.1 cobalamin adenosyltransferase [Photobacterium kishitanii]PSU91175.1 cobalamin adenosyltransferase [Photobacterium kishitanii]
MVLKFSGDIDELAYPFIFEDSPLCDFEILTDELCTYIGLAISQLDDGEVQQSLIWLQPRIFHLNGSIRGKCGIFEADISQLKADYHYFRSQVSDNNKRFVLPRGVGPVVQLHQCRSLAKKVVRQLVKVDAAGKKVPPALPRFSNLLVNYLFALTRVLNQQTGIEEPEYISINYPKPEAKK